MIVKICAATLCAVILGMILKELGFSGARLLSICTFSALMVFSVSRFGEIQTELLGMEKLGGVVGLTKDMMKIIGVGYLFGICSDICLDFGEAMLSKGLLTTGKIEILILTIPTLKEILKMTLDVFK